MDSIDIYIANANIAHQEALVKLRNILRDTLMSLGYVECMSYGMLGYVVPKTTYPS